MMAAEMAIIRLTHVADLPTPGDLVRKLKDAPPGGIAAPASGPSNGGGSGPVARGPVMQGGAATALARQPDEALARYQRFEQVVDLIRSNRDAKLLIDVETGLRLVRYAPGRIEFTPTEDAPRDLAARLGGALGRWTGVRWGVSVVSGGTEATIAETRDAAAEALRRSAMAHPMMQAVLDAFPGARIVNIRTQEEIAAEASVEALPEVDDEWDPFAED
jgi:DNA polymerase-3 subunit gamma/tau